MCYDTCAHISIIPWAPEPMHERAARSTSHCHGHPHWKNNYAYRALFWVLLTNTKGKIGYGESMKIQRPKGKIYWKRPTEDNWMREKCDQRKSLVCGNWVRMFERVSFGECVVKTASCKLVWTNGVGSILKSLGNRQHWLEITWRGWGVCLNHLHFIARREGMGGVGKEEECECNKEGMCMRNFVCLYAWVCVCVCARVYVVFREELLGFNLASFVNFFVISSEFVSLSTHSSPLPPPPWDLLPYLMCICVSLSVPTSLLHSLSLSFNGIILSSSLCLPPTHLLLRFVENTPTLLPEQATFSRLPTLCR